MDKPELVQLLQDEVKSLSTYLESDDYDHAIDDAERDCNWTLPQTTAFRIKWLKGRAKRHLFFMLLSESAHKFKYKQINLNQRFDHYRSLVEYMDREFIAAIEANPAEFENVDIYKFFGTKVDAGFSYDDFGRETTFQSDQKVIFNPTE